MMIEQDIFKLEIEIRCKFILKLSVTEYDLLINKRLKSWNITVKKNID